MKFNMQAERDFAIRNLDRDSRLLREVRTALLRIHVGCFGTCVDCEEPITPKRLAALPWAARCIQCQEVADKRAADVSSDVPAPHKRTSGSAV